MEDNEHAHWNHLVRGAERDKDINTLTDRTILAVNAELVRLKADAEILAKAVKFCGTFFTQEVIDSANRILNG